MTDSGEHPVEFFSGGRLFRVREPGVLFLLGTDGYGRDVFSRLLYGGRISLLTGVLAAFVSLGLGMFFGTLAGYYTGWVDSFADAHVRVDHGAAVALFAARGASGDAIAHQPLVYVSSADRDHRRGGLGASCTPHPGRGPER